MSAAASPAPAQVPTPAPATAPVRPSAPRRGVRRRISDNVTALLVIGALKLILHFPDRPIWVLANLAGVVSYRFSPARRDLARRNLRRVLEWMAANGKGDA